MQFLSGNELSNAIKKLMFGKKIRCAVAFWGTGSETLFSTACNNDIRIVCNLRMGGTNPFSLDGFLPPRFTVRQHDTLHAKVYISETAAIVASANASTNGLGFEGREQAAWHEAGLFTEDRKMVDEIGGWFESIWCASRPIEEDDIKNAKAAWKSRQASKPSLTSFADFEVNAPNLPLIWWYGDEEWVNNPKLTQDSPPAESDLLKRRIDDGIFVEGKQDREALTPGTWVLSFRRTQRGLPDTQIHLSWINVGRILENASQYQGEQDWRPVALSAERPVNPPFPIAEVRFRNSFRNVISRDEFSQLRTDEYEEAWFTTARLDLMRKFWQALRDAYLAAR